MSLYKAMAHTRIDLNKLPNSDQEEQMSHAHKSTDVPTVSDRQQHAPPDFAY